MSSPKPSPRPDEVFRPRWGRLIPLPLAAVCVLTCGAVAVFLPRTFAVADRLGILGIGVAMAAVLIRVASVRIETDGRGLTVVNVLTRRRLDWAQVVDLRLGVGDPWLVLDLSSGDSLAAMGIQGSDGEHARDQARSLGRLVAARTRTDYDN